MKNFLKLKPGPLFGILMVVPVVLLPMWLYLLGTNLPKKLPPTLTMNSTKFKLFLFVSIACKLVLSAFVVMLVSKILAGEQLSLRIFAFLIPLHLFSAGCVVYCLYFIAKALKTVELQKPVMFIDFAVEFFLLLFFPVGIWFIQPKINHLFNN